jgi:hypothetical protein
MTFRPTPTQTADTLTHIEQLTARLRLLEPELRRRAQDTALDGYARQSGPGAGGHGGGDPTGTTVALRLDHPHRDTQAHAHTQLLNHIDQARRHLEQAESAGCQSLPPTTGQLLDDGCVSCWRIKTWSPINRTRRCRFCSDWAYAHGGEDPPIDILRARRDGRRITTRLVDAITRRHR